MKAGASTEVVTALAPHLEPPEVADQDAPVRACHRYLRNRPGQFDSSRALAAELPIGSGKSECRDAQDAKRDIQVALSPSLVTTAYYAPAALRPCRFATPSQARYWLRSTPSNNGMVRPAS